MRNSFFKAIEEISDYEEKSIFLTGDLGFKLFDPIRKKYPDRFLNMGIAEANMIGVAAGLALEGFIPIVYSIVPFVSIRCLEQIRNDIIYNGLNVKIVGVGAGYSYGLGGPTHYGIDDVSLIKSLPGIDILSPGDPIETSVLTHNMIKKQGPSYLRIGRGGEPIVHKKGTKFEIGKGITVQEGNEICFFVSGGMLSVVSNVAKRLDKQGIKSCVVSLPTIRPLDDSLILSSIKDKKIVIVAEENIDNNGLASSIIELLYSNKQTIPIKSFSIPNVVNKTVGDQDFLRKTAGISEEDIYNFASNYEGLA